MATVEEYGVSHPAPEAAEQQSAVFSCQRAGPAPDSSETAKQLSAECSRQRAGPAPDSPEQLSAECSRQRAGPAPDSPEQLLAECSRQWAGLAPDSPEAAEQLSAECSRQWAGPAPDSAEAAEQLSAECSRQWAGPAPDSAEAAEQLSAECSRQWAGPAPDSSEAAEQLSAECSRQWAGPAPDSSEAAEQLSAECGRQWAGPAPDSPEAAEQLSAECGRQWAGPAPDSAEVGEQLSAAQRARMERSRQRARALRAARLVQRPHMDGASTSAGVDSGGGFLLAGEAAAAPRPARAPPAPVADPAERPRCLHCERLFAHSYLFDTFGHHACDECRDDAGEHALLTRTEAKREFLLQDCDLDLREPALRCVRRRNPHARCGDMRLYLRAQLAARAALAWGGAAALAAERARREAARAAARGAAAARRLRALRMDVRSSLYAGARAPHEHAFGAERHDAAADVYSRACACGHVETYEKM